MNTSTLPAIEVCGVTKRFGTVTALDDVSFTIQQGEMFFLLGPSGCGKTTLLRILAGLETPDAGRIVFKGKDVALLAPHERGAPMVFQNYALWPHLNVRENVAFGLVERRISKGEQQQRVDDVLKRVGLETLGHRMPGQLSGGQQQRVVLARALVLNPFLILLDEPLSNLDAKLRVEMREEIEKLHATTDITFVYVTHDQADALSLADRMAVMSAGRVDAIGTPLGLYTRPPTAFCAEFLGEANMIDGETEGGGSVRTVLGDWRISAPGVGGPIHCLVRPENLGPVTGRSEGMNIVEAEVTGLRMNGPTVTVMLAAGGMALRATVLTQNSLELRKGLRMPWGVAVNDTVAIPRVPCGHPGC
jgi:iron(III) transport system ATP-binding protein